LAIELREQMGKKKRAHWWSFAYSGTKNTEGDREKNETANKMLIKESRE